MQTPISSVRVVEEAKFDTPTSGRIRSAGRGHKLSVDFIRIHTYTYLVVGNWKELRKGLRLAVAGA